MSLAETKTRGIGFRLQANGAIMEKARKVIHIILFFIFRPLAYILPFRLYLGLIKVLSLISALFYYKRRRTAKNNLLLI